MASERITDEDIDDLHVVSKRDGMRRWRLAMVELRERRAADLTSEDREALRWVLSALVKPCIYRYAVDETTFPERLRIAHHALAILDRLLGAK